MQFQLVDDPTVLPTSKMVAADLASLPVMGPCPLPKSYRDALNNSAPGQLGNGEMQQLARNRLGEYTLQECQVRLLFASPLR